MIAVFSNGDPPLTMQLTIPQVGLYSATQSPRRAAPQVRVTARATHATLSPSTAEIIAGVNANKAPILFANATMGNADPVPGAPLAPEHRPDYGFESCPVGCGGIRLAIAKDGHRHDCTDRSPRGALFSVSPDVRISPRRMPCGVR